MANLHVRSTTDPTEARGTTLKVLTYGTAPDVFPFLSHPHVGHGRLAPLVGWGWLDASVVDRLRHVHQGGWGQEAVAPPGHRGNEAWRPRGVAQRLAQRTNGNAHHGIRHSRLGPHRVQEFGFRDEAVRVRHQVREYIKHFGG
jgi:hypothetical protein